jgi:hypothetical protein
LETGLKRAFHIVLVVIAIAVGIVTTLSFVFDNDVLRNVRALFAEWAVIIVAFAMLLGVLNVLRVHAQRIQHGQGTVYSVILVISFLGVFVPGILSPDRVPAVLRDWVGPSGTIVDFAYRYVQRPLQATIFSLMAFFVFTAAWRAFRIRSTGSLIMFIAALVVLLGSMRLTFGGWTLLTEAREWVMRVPVKAGARGVLLGIALGTIVTGVRFLLGVDRPYSD